MRKSDHKTVDAALAAYWCHEAEDIPPCDKDHRRDGFRSAQTLRNLDVVIKWLQEKRRALAAPLSKSTARVLQKNCPRLSRKWKGTCADDVLDDLIDIGEALDLAAEREK